MNNLMAFDEKDRLNWPEIAEHFYLNREQKLLVIPHEELTKDLTPFGKGNSSARHLS